MGGKIGKGNNLNFPASVFLYRPGKQATTKNASLIQYMEDIFKVLFGGLQNNLFHPRPLAINVDGDATRAPRKIFSSARIPNIE